jgi:chaperonin cofactor prefoldin
MNRMIGRMIRNRTQIYSFRKFSTPKEVYELKLEELTKKMEKMEKNIDKFDKSIQNKVNENNEKNRLFQSFIIGTVLGYTVWILCRF